MQFRSGKKSVASVSKTGIIRAKKAGTEKITAAVRMGTSGSKQRKKTVWMKVRVVKPQNPSATDRPANTAVPTDTPSLDSGRILIAYFTRSGNAETLSYLPLLHTWLYMSAGRRAGRYFVWQRMYGKRQNEAGVIVLQNLF